jgi:hypothetical protein
MTCAAFPEGVPDEYRFGREAHVFPVAGDHGIQFEMAPNLPASSRRVALRIVAAAEQQQPASKQREPS